MTIAVKDKFLSSSELKELQNTFEQERVNLAGEYSFIEKNLIDCNSSESFLDRCVQYASEYFNLSSMVGYEYWYNINLTELHKHIDKDEVTYEETGIEKHPLCTIIFYLDVEDEKTGKLNFENFSVSHVDPKTNRIICFSPGIAHSVERCDSKRISIAICPWDYKVRKWNPNKNKQIAIEHINEITIPISSLTMQNRKRECDGCTECCQGWLQGVAHGKSFYPGKPCHFVSATGCSIYEDRPQNPCKHFRCGWLDELNLFPEWLKPNKAKIIAQKLRTKSGVEFYEITECGQKIDASVLNHLILTALSGGANFRIQIGGGWANYGDQKFLSDMS